MILNHAPIETPTGPMQLVTDETGHICAFEWDTHMVRLDALLRRHFKLPNLDLRQADPPKPIQRAIDAYFGGDLDALRQLPVRMGGTSFQQHVWQGLRDIPAGQTLSYGGFAAKLGCPKAMRAVGSANGKNPIGIIVPCHRVIAADGGLGGYGGGLARKAWLLRHEGALQGHNAQRQLSL